jgi:hypothetical protein
VAPGHPRGQDLGRSFFAAVTAAAVITSSWLPLLLIGLPSIYGAWLYNFFG